MTKTITYKGHKGKFGHRPSQNISEKTLGRLIDKFEPVLIESVQSIVSIKRKSKTLSNIKQIIKLYGFKYAPYIDECEINGVNIGVRVWQLKGCENSLDMANMALGHAKDWAEEYCEINASMNDQKHFYHVIGRKRQAICAVQQQPPQLPPNRSNEKVGESKNSERSEKEIYIDFYYKISEIMSDSIRKLSQNSLEHPLSYYVKEYNDFSLAIPHFQVHCEDWQIANIIAIFNNFHQLVSSLQQKENSQ